MVSAEGKKTLMSIAGLTFLGCRGSPSSRRHCKGGGKEQAQWRGKEDTRRERGCCRREELPLTRGLWGGSSDMAMGHFPKRVKQCSLVLGLVGTGALQTADS